jgi:hypothetical protein
MQIFKTFVHSNFACLAFGQPVHSIEQKGFHLGSPEHALMSSQDYTATTIAGSCQEAA